MTVVSCRDVFALVLALVVVGSGGDQRVQAQNQSSYPTWFKTTPSGSSVLWAVGYAPGYSKLQDGLEAAKKDAYDALRRARRVVIIGEKLYESAPGYGTSIEGKKFVEMGLPDTLRSVNYVDSLNAAGMTLVLAAWSSGDPPSLPSSLRRRGAFSESSPSWVQKSRNGALEGNRAVGVAPRYYNREHSWALAEKRARQKLAFEAATKVRSLTKKTEDWRHDVRSLTTGVDLRNVQVRSRWEGNENCYVLIEGQVKDVLLDK